MEKLWNSELIVAALFGALFYFILEYVAKKKTGFSLLFWIKDNWINLVVLLAVVSFTSFMEMAMSKWVAAMLGFNLSKIIDYVQDLFTKEHA